MGDETYARRFCNGPSTRRDNVEGQPRIKVGIQKIGTSILRCSVGTTSKIQRNKKCVPEYGTDEQPSYELLRCTTDIGKNWKALAIGKTIMKANLLV